MNRPTPSTAPTTPPVFVVIGYGSQRRGDDILGPQVASLVRSLKLPNVTAYGVERLTPELASRLAIADYAIFVDACRLEPAEVRVTPLAPCGSETAGSSAPCSGHSCDPGSLLALAHSAFGHAPQAWWVEIPASEFAPGHAPDRQAQAGANQALQIIDDLIRNTFTHARPAHS